MIGALNLFTTGRRPLSDNDLAVAQGMADIATIGLLHERTVRDQVALSEQLQTALQSRILIEQAKGVLSAQTGTSVAAAFTLMRSHARHTGQPLTTLAGAIVAGRVDGSALQQGASQISRAT
ncbi:MAG: response regulator receiver and domain protein [Streptosporangiaceae bacterium]|nr:response regulator receiver and domain protein [Streptosporangiaceae bacterium]